MKKIFLIGCFCNIFWVLSAQVDVHPWAPPGAVWLYKGSSMVSDLYFKLVYEKDTMVLNKQVKKIVVTKFEYIGIFPNIIKTRDLFVANEYMYHSNDSVFWYNNNQFQLLYLFSAGIGTSWTIQKSSYFTCLNAGTPDTNTLTLRNVQQLSLANRQFTVMDANPQPYWTIGTRLVKNIGSTRCPFPIPGSLGCSVVDGNSGLPSFLTCYYDNLRGRLDFGGLGKCEELITTTKDVYSKESTQSIFNIFPNPVSDRLHIVNPYAYEIKKISIFDMYGKLQIAATNTDNRTLDIQDLSNGMYIIVIQTANSFNHSIKFVKSK
jgi:hypothetical protein